MWFHLMVAEDRVNESLANQYVNEMDRKKENKKTNSVYVSPRCTKFLMVSNKTCIKPASTTAKCTRI